MNKSYKNISTRHRILVTAFREIHRKGFRATSVNDILEKCKLTKGAFYYHFKKKLSLGYAIVDELVRDIIYEVWLQPLETCENPIDCLIDMLISAKIDKNMVFEGCPLNNLAVEMAPIDEGFRQRLNHVYEMWITVIAGSLSRGIHHRQIRPDIDTYETAAFIVASMAGCRSLAKNAQSTDLLTLCHNSLMLYFESLRA
ncbi:TetR family transcriptional regulator C-terminal domain-containing protein [Candidatus Latescibacterota bacterium]